MAYKPIESGVISILLNDTDVAALVSNRVFPVVVPQGQARPAITVARTATDRDPESLETDHIARATIEIRGIAGGYQLAAEVAKQCRIALQEQQSTLGDHNIVFVAIDDESDEFELDTSEAMGKGFYHRVLKYTVEYFE